MKKFSLVIKILRKNSGSFAATALDEIAEERDPFKVLISCILSLRTRDETTARVSKKLYQLADNPKDMAKLSENDIARVIKSVNYYKTKAKRIKSISKLLIEKFNGKVPDDLDTLLTFKGVGRKTANIVIVYGFNKQGIPVDVHVHKISNRLGWVDTKSPEKTEIELRKILPKQYWMDLNDLFVQFGQNICLSRKPKCETCPISKYCKYYKNLKTTSSAIK